MAHVGPRRDDALPDTVPSDTVPPRHRRAWSGLELLKQGPTQREVGGAVVGLVQDVEVLATQPNAAEAIGALGHVGAPDQIRAADQAPAVRTMLASEQAFGALAMRRVRALHALDAVVAADQVLRVPAEGALRAAAASLTADALVVVALRLELGDELAVASFELGRRQPDEIEQVLREVLTKAWGLL